MTSTEIRDLDLARRYVLQGLLIQRALPPLPGTVRSVLEWSLEIASSGQPLPPTGFVADVGHAALGTDSEHRTKEPQPIPGFPAALARSYEDHVLGKLYADWLFERAGDALRRYADKDRPRGLAYIIRQIRERGGLGGVLLSPAILRGMLGEDGEKLLRQGRDDLQREGPLPLLVSQYHELIAAARRMAEVLAPEDVLALEQRTALADMGQYVAHRQILRTTSRLEADMPVRPVQALAGRKEVPARIQDEDQYPVGGYASLSTRGSIESLLHSQLAFMELDERPDLFDVKFVRDELFYYARDENQFLRRRRAFVIVFYPDLLAGRFKDAELPTQRLVMAISLVLALARKLSDWLSTDAIRWDILFVQDGEKKLLLEEATLLSLLLREPIERGDASVTWLPGEATVKEFLANLSRASQVHGLLVSSQPRGMEVEGISLTSLVVAGPRPAIDTGNGLEELPGEDAYDSWKETLLRLLQLWI